VTRLYVLGSGSRGNCFALASDEAVLLIDAGFSCREIERRAALAGLDLAGLVGIVLTHEHGDHASGVPRLVQRRRVPILSSRGTWSRLYERAPGAHHVVLGMRGSVVLGPFTVTACPTSHDAAEPLALAIECSDGVRVGVAYDLGRPTAAVRYLLRDAHALILEANHDEVLLRTSGYPPSVQQRIAGSGGHLSNRAAAELLRELCHEGLAHVVLAHLSERCNSLECARAEVSAALEELGFGGVLHVAEQAGPLAPLEIVLETVG
jgi:phosphoribosyl 1,2-cyclic phosphodiesterase